MRGIAVGPGYESKECNEWISLGKRIGALEDEKAQLLAEQSNAATGTALVQARNRWIRVVNALLADAELVEIDTATDVIIFGALRDAEKRAEGRSRAIPADTLTSSDSDTTAGTG